jgi:hypothetical protein
VDPVSRAEAKRHRQAFVKHLKQAYPATVGYVWKAEKGPVKSYHVHTLLIFNGQLVREDVTIGMQLGEYWVREITGGKGTYWSCNARKGEYSNLAIGMVHHDDDATWAVLKKIAQYLTKVDYFVKDNVPKKDRCFGKGGLPKLAGKRRGRPRKTPASHARITASDVSVLTSPKASDCESPAGGRAESP